MILSMTGYGGAQHSENDVSYALEIRSLNNRYFKANIKLPEFLSAFEGNVEKLLRTRISRGSITFTLRVRNNSADAALTINKAALQSYLDQLGQMPTSEQTRIDLSVILTLPGVCQSPEIDETERERQWVILEQMTVQAMDSMIEMRKIEGQALREDLHKQCQAIHQHLDAVASRSPEVLKTYHQKMLQRANELLNSAEMQLNLDDIKREVAVYAERCDVNEEISRLGSHLEQFENMFVSSEPAGRKLDFITQEILREANTIASKANDADIAHHIVEIKGSIDRLKEQVQNVE